MLSSEFNAQKQVACKHWRCGLPGEAKDGPECATMNCWKCGHRVESLDRPGFRDRCTKCDWPLHVCRNCSFYDPTFNNQCRETMAERVVDKDRSNFCEYFSPNSVSKDSRAKPSMEGTARDRLEALFRKK